MKVLIPSPLLSYTNAGTVAASGATLTELLADLDRQYPGLRFRVPFFKIACGTMAPRQQVVAIRPL